MRLLSIDPGYEKVGWAIFDKHLKEKDYQYIASGLIKTAKTLTQERRLLQIHEEVRDIAVENKVDYLVIEKLFFFKNHKTVLEVSQAVGVIQLVGAKYSLPITWLTPLEIKQTITGYGNADKESIKKMIKLTLKDKIPIEDDDQSDAIACGLAYCLRSNNLEY